MRATIGLTMALVFPGWIGAEAPPFLYQIKPLRPEPFAETPLQINPPTFRWPLAEIGAVSYRLELARTADFAEAEAVVVDDLFYRPSQPLSVGTWYWRVRAETAESGSWLGPEHFVVDEALPCWPLPPWREILAQVPAGHPRTYLRAGDLADVRARAAQRADVLGPLIAGIKEQLSTPYVLSSYAAELAPGVDPLGPDNRGRRQIIKASKAAAHDAVTPMVAGAWGWVALGDPALRDAVKARALLVAGFDPKGFITERNLHHDPANLDFGNAAIVHGLGVVYDFLYDEFTPGERAQLRQAILARAAPIFVKMHETSRELMRAHAWQHGFRDALVGALAIRDEVPEAEEWLELGLKSFVALYPWFGGNDGGSQEGPHYYQLHNVGSALDTLDVFRSAFGLRLEEGNPWFRETGWYLLYSFPPHETVAQFGDWNRFAPGSEEERRTPGGQARTGAERLARLSGNGYFAAYASVIQSADRTGGNLVDVLRWAGLPVPVPSDLSKLPAARAFRDVGEVYMHSAWGNPTDNVRLSFRSSPYGGHGHAHADQNSFHLIAYDESLFIDSGYYTSTGDAHRQQWTVRTKAHNTLLIDGQGQPWGDNTGYGQLAHFAQNADWVYAVGAADTAYPATPLARFDRHVVWLKGDAEQTYVLIDDVVTTGGEARQFGWLLHAPMRMEIEAGSRRVDVRGVRGQARATFLTPMDLQFTQTRGFEHVPKEEGRADGAVFPDQWHLTAMTTGRSAEQRFVTVIQVMRIGSDYPALESLVDGVAAAGWRVRLPEGARRVVIEKAETRIETP